MSFGKLIHTLNYESQSRVYISLKYEYLGIESRIKFSFYCERISIIRTYSLSTSTRLN